MYGYIGYARLVPFRQLPALDPSPDPAGASSGPKDQAQAGLADPAARGMAPDVKPGWLARLLRLFA